MKVAKKEFQLTFISSAILPTNHPFFVGCANTLQSTWYTAVGTSFVHKSGFSTNNGLPSVLVDNTEIITAHSNNPKLVNRVSHRSSFFFVFDFGRKILACKVMNKGGGVGVAAAMAKQSR